MDIPGPVWWFEGLFGVTLRVSFFFSVLRVWGNAEKREILGQVFFFCAISDPGLPTVGTGTVPFLWEIFALYFYLIRGGRDSTNITTNYHKQFFFYYL